ncbi:MAG: response regulator transcription factor [Actinomycetota bacterium]|nr:response regulator transcription factor [Actinomycetota bacterium]
MNQALRLLVADDHPLFRRGLRDALEATPGFEVVAEATNGAEAVQFATELSPDVVLMDLQMPEINGVEATRQILRARPDIHILVLTMFDSDSSVFAAVRAGAKGYLLKGSDQQDVERAIRTVAAGEAVFGTAIAARLVSYFDGNRTRAFPELTPREHDVLELLADGLDNQAIAETLMLSLKTVRNNVSAIFTKLRVADRAQAMLKARESGLGRGD